MSQFCAISQSDSSAIIQLKTNVQKAIDEKYFPSISGLHWLASCLDPSFKTFHFVPNGRSPEERQFKFQLLKDVEQSAMNYLGNHVKEFDASPNTKNDVLASVFDFCRVDSDDGMDNARSFDDAQHELQLYKAKAHRSPGDRNPLSFWNGSAAEFPMLSAVAKEIFSAQATSAQSERDFSQAGLTRTARRAQMSAKKLSDVEFLSAVVKKWDF